MIISSIALNSKRKVSENKTKKLDINFIKRITTIHFDNKNRYQEMICDPVSKLSLKHMDTKNIEPTI